MATEFDLYSPDGSVRAISRSSRQPEKARGYEVSQGKDFLIASASPITMQPLPQAEEEKE